MPKKTKIRISGNGVASIDSRDLLKSEKVRDQIKRMQRHKRKPA